MLAEAALQEQAMHVLVLQVPFVGRDPLALQKSQPPGIHSSDAVGPATQAHAARTCVKRTPGWDAGSDADAP